MRNKSVGLVQGPVKKDSKSIISHYKKSSSKHEDFSDFKKRILSARVSVTPKVEKTLKQVSQTLPNGFPFKP
jgi:hypothetical protein